MGICLRLKKKYLKIYYLCFLKYRLCKYLFFVIKKIGFIFTQYIFIQKPAGFKVDPKQ